MCAGKRERGKECVKGKERERHKEKEMCVGKRERKKDSVVVF